MIRKVFLSVFICFLIISCNKKEDEVSQIEATSVSISEADVTISVGGREKLEINVEPEGVDLSRSVWRSSDTNIVKVDEKGVVTARAEGKATVSYTTSNSLSKQCEFTVVSSPVSSLVLPDPDFPIGIGLQMFLMGQGFTSGQKIWFRPLQRGDGFKNCNDGDILGVIHEVASNYISVTGGVSGGWYSLLLESGGELFNLGNFQFATYTVPPFEYDPNKILWDDTHWRLFHLRGKVKRMVIKYSYMDIFPNYLSLDFNSHGFLIKQCPRDTEIPAYTTYYEYDNQNRLIKKFGFEKDHSGDFEINYVTVKYSYGNHDNYINVDFLSDRDEVAISSPSIQWFQTQMDSYSYFYPIIMYYKGLVSVDVALKTTKGDLHFNSNINFAGDSAYCTKSNSRGDKQYLKWKFKNGFPILSTCYTDRPLKEDYAHGYFTKFQPNGMVGSIRPFYYNDHDTISNDTIARYQVSFFPSKPFLMISEVRWYGCNELDRFLYDSNEDMSSSSWYLSLEHTYNFHYMSYDKYGNWTQCIVVDNFGDYSLYKQDITYW